MKATLEEILVKKEIETADGRIVTQIRPNSAGIIAVLTRFAKNLKASLE
jgi:hypothetical protein